MTVRAALAAVLACLAPAAAAHADPGDLDLRFGSGGTALVPVGIGDAQAGALAVAPDGGLLVAGDAQVREPDDSGAGGRQLVVVRTGAFGAHDWTFTFPPREPAADTGAAAVAVRPDGRIAAAGQSLVAAEGRQGGLVALLGEDGELDPAFGGGRGWVEHGFAAGGAADVAPLPDGGLLVAGTSAGGGTARGELVRLRPDGSGDPAFGAEGLAASTAADGRFERYDAVAALADGGALVAGAADLPDGDQGFLLARFAPDGGVARATATPFPGGVATAHALLALPDGSAIVAGSAGGGAAADWALARYRPDGTLDPSFGDDGRVVTAASAYEDRLLALAAGPGATIVAAGSAGAEGGSRTEFAVARFLPSGRLDPAFGRGGVVRVPLPGDAAAAGGVAALRDGSVVAAGTAQHGGRSV
ncbi:MAG TPA: hypothetical protein VHF89_18895, partial [Solirubrobacteraceae bacterium]|nr:hypothetical protein [Solirubrobacteraceae bacterium]